MTTRKKITILTIGTYAGAIISILALVGMVYASIGKTLDEKIDNRIDSKSRYIVILLKQIASKEQLKKADEEYSRWNTTNK